MRVNQSGNNQVQNAEVSGAKKTDRTGKGESSKRTEKGKSSEASASVNADISAKGKEFSKAKAVAADAPDVREEKVAELRRRIADGKYKVDSDAVADRLVDDHIKMSGMS